MEVVVGFGMAFSWGALAVFVIWASFATIDGFDLNGRKNKILNNIGIAAISCFAFFLVGLILLSVAFSQVTFPK